MHKRLIKNYTKVIFIKVEFRHNILKNIAYQKIQKTKTSKATAIKAYKVPGNGIEPSLALQRTGF